MKRVVAGSKTPLKTELYGMARLRSRDLDADFHDGKMMLDTGTETFESELSTPDTDDTVFENSLREFETSASQIATPLFESALSPLTTRKSTSQAAAGGTCGVIRNIFVH